MCENAVLIPINEVNEDIIKKFNTEYQQKRIEFSMAEIIENLDKLYTADI